MSRCFYLCASICLFLTAAAAPADDPKDSKPEMGSCWRGDWTLTSLEVNGAKVAPERLGGGDHFCQRGQIHLQDGGGERRRGCTR